MNLLFEWDKEKSITNIKKHRVTFEEASSVFGDPRSLTIDDPKSYSSEERFITIGLSLLGNILVVVHTDRDDKIRIISARKAMKKEWKQYEK